MFKVTKQNIVMLLGVLAFVIFWVYTGVSSLDSLSDNISRAVYGNYKNVTKEETIHHCYEIIGEYIDLAYEESGR